jgi:hypothetical protein
MQRKVASADESSPSSAGVPATEDAGLMRSIKQSLGLGAKEEEEPDQQSTFLYKTHDLRSQNTQIEGWTIE